MFSRFFTKVFCADASQNQRGSVPQPPSPLDALKPETGGKDSGASDDARPTSSFSSGKKNVGTMEELHKKCKGKCFSPSLTFHPPTTCL